MWGGGCGSFTSCWGLRTSRKKAQGKEINQQSSAHVFQPLLSGRGGVSSQALVTKLSHLLPGKISGLQVTFSWRGLGSPELCRKVAVTGKTLSKLRSPLPTSAVGPLACLGTVRLSTVTRPWAQSQVSYSCHVRRPLLPLGQGRGREGRLTAYKVLRDLPTPVPGLGPQSPSPWTLGTLPPPPPLSWPEQWPCLACSL